MTYPTVLPPPLGDEAALTRYMSAYGIRSWSNHTETDDEGTVGEDLPADEEENDHVLYDCQVYAGSYIASKLSRRYEYANLDNSPLMIEVWCIIVLRTLCFRRANPPPASLEFRYQELTQKDGLLDQIADGRFPLTDESGTPMRPKNSNAPGWSNLHVDRFYPESKVRVVSGCSDMSTSRLARRVDRFPESFQ